MAADQTATVKEADNKVYHGLSLFTETTAKTGTLLHDGEYLKTKELSRAELLLPSESVTRLGANTIFNYSVASNTVDLRAGTILFCKPKDAKQLNIKTAAVTAGIVGTTGFVQVQMNEKTKLPAAYQIGLIEGHVTVTLLSDGSTHEVKPGEIFTYIPGKGSTTFLFDVPLMVKTSPLFTKFKGPLPNQKYIDEEITQYLNDQRRGFIQPTGGNQNNTNYAGIPTVPTTAFDSAGNAQGQGGNTPPPPSNNR